MLEDSMMEKKSLNRSTQSQSRVSAADCKKNSEVTHKPLPRHKKKRETPPKHELCRKNVPPTSARGRSQGDKKPRPRGQNEFLMGGASNSGIDLEEPEVGSVFAPGSKKQNLNHLLNFMYTPRGATYRNQGIPSPRRYSLQATPKKHNQDLYLQASCQFVVKEGGDYTLNLVNPDKLIEWDQIEEIVVRSTGRPECPICLGPPVAGRVWRCGHVHCWPCALHYVASHDQQPPPCPVCAAPFHVDHMKPARILQWASPCDEVSMRLVRRLRGSTVVEVAPARGKICYQTPSLLPIESINNAPYTKLFVATYDQVSDILEREQKELERQILDEIDTTEIVYIEKALKLLNNQKERINKNNYISSIVPKPDNSEAVPVVYEGKSANESKIDWFEMTGEEDSDNGNHSVELNEVEYLSGRLQSYSLNSDESKNSFDVTEFPLIESTPENNEEFLDDNASLTDLDKENKSKYFYFYQAEDGQQVFLHSLNVRILNASWGSLVAAPPLIHGEVLRRETSSLTEQIRKHMPCAAHLPLHCPFDIVELKLSTPYVTTEALQTFSEDVERRARARARLLQKEKRREHIYKNQMEGPPKPDLTSEIQFPTPSTLTYSSPPLAEPFAVPLSKVDSPITVEIPHSSQGLSFAKLAGGSGTWRVRKTKTPSPPPTDMEESSPRCALNLSDAIQAALDTAPAISSSKKRNKKVKQTLLFATGVHHSAQ